MLLCFMGTLERVVNVNSHLVSSVFTMSQLLLCFCPPLVHIYTFLDESKIISSKHRNFFANLLFIFFTTHFQCDTPKCALKTGSCKSSPWVWQKRVGKRSFLEERESLKKKGLRMVPYPVDQSQPLSVNVSIGEHTLVCVQKSVCAAQREGGGGGGRRASCLLCVHTLTIVYVPCSSQPMLIEEKTTSPCFSLLYFLQHVGQHVLGWLNP